MKVKQGLASDSQQRRCLGHLAPAFGETPDSASKPPSRIDKDHSTHVDSKPKNTMLRITEPRPSKTTSKAPSSRHRVPIRKPNLIGKSVDGSAFHAREAARLRASSSRRSVLPQFPRAPTRSTARPSPGHNRSYSSPGIGKTMADRQPGSLNSSVPVPLSGRHSATTMPLSNESLHQRSLSDRGVGDRWEFTTAFRKRRLSSSSRVVSRWPISRYPGEKRDHPLRWELFLLQSRRITASVVELPDLLWRIVKTDFAAFLASFLSRCFSCVGSSEILNASTTQDGSGPILILTKIGRSEASPLALTRIVVKHRNRSKSLQCNVWLVHKPAHAKTTGVLPKSFTAPNKIERLVHLMDHHLSEITVRILVVS